MTETKLRLGLLRLCDSAPVIFAHETGLFTASGLNVTISVEPSWANIADKLSYGLLDGAVMLPPLALACAAGLRGRKTDLAVPMSLSAKGNAIVLTSKLHSLLHAKGLRGVIGAKRPRLAVVHQFSTHDLVLRDWLAANGIDAELDVELTALPPAEMVDSLRGGSIDGFCAGAPWAHVAADAGLGFTVVKSHEIWPGHPEKCLALQANLVARNPTTVTTLIRVLRAACSRCSDPARRLELAACLAQPRYLDLPANVLANALDATKGGPDFTELYPDPRHEVWFRALLVRWGKAAADDFSGLAPLYRPDLFLNAGGAPPTDADAFTA